MKLSPVEKAFKTLNKIPPEKRGEYVRKEIERVSALIDAKNTKLTVQDSEQSQDLQAMHSEIPVL